MNKLGLLRQDYVGSKSTLCTGCGHDSITQHLITALYQSNINPYDLAKMSGIGCSSKTPAYFLNQSHGFNTIHGRMAPIATGVKIANHKLMLLGISGDGDTASIGLGSFAHMVRRNLPIVYIIENNGVYGLTKGQFSATADRGSIHKGGGINSFSSVDLCSMAIDLGCSFVARSFSGDPKQLVPLLSAAFRHNGTAVIDVISPCITFANHEGSTRSFTSVKSRVKVLHEIGLVEPQEQITVDYEDRAQIDLSDGSKITLRKIHEHDHGDAADALRKIYDSRIQNEILTGLLFYKQNSSTLLDHMDLNQKPLSQMNEADTRLSTKDFSAILDTFC